MARRAHLGRWTAIGFVVPFAATVLLGPAMPIAAVAVGLVARRSDRSTRALLVQYGVGVTGWMAVAFPFALSYRESAMVVVVVLGAAVQLLAFALGLLGRRPAIADATA